MSETERVITDPTAAAESARVELDARAKKLRASGWVEPVENRPCLIYKTRQPTNSAPRIVEPSSPGRANL